MSPLWADFRAALSQPEYVHVLLNPIPVYGLAAAIAAFVIAWAAGSRSGQAIALLLIALTAAAAGPAARFGHQGYDRVYSLSDAPAQKWLNWHEHIGHRVVWIDYGAAVLAAAALVAVWRQSRRRGLWSAAALLAALIAFGSGAFLAFAGGKIRHSEFRDHPPPPWAHTSGDNDSG